MLDGEYICYGSCLDLQSLARSEDFYEDSFLDLFKVVTKMEKHTLREARNLCLNHQLKLLEQMLENKDENTDLVNQTLKYVQEAIKFENKQD